MSWTPVPVDNFGGLIIGQDPEQIGLENAVDSLNVDGSSATELRARPGTGGYASVTGGSVITLVSSTANNFPIIVSTGSTNGTTYFGSSTTTSADHPTSMVNYGTPSASNVYFAPRAATGQIGKITSAGVFSSVASTPDADYLAVTPASNRLVAAKDSKVSFSDPLDPETFIDSALGKNKYVYLDPGDGERIQGMITWQDKLFVFKSSKIFVFGPESIDGTGNPTFPYRVIKNTEGMAAAGLVCEAFNGVYFYALDGIYRTTGEPAVKVSGDIDGWFRKVVDPLAVNVPATTSATYSLGADYRRLYLGTSNGTFVMDLLTGAWTVWSLNVTAVGQVSGSALLAVANSALIPSYSTHTDNGAAIPVVYRSGLSDLGAPVVKTVTGADVWGQGAPTLSLYTDHHATDPGAAVVTLGGASTDRGIQRYARRGTFFGIGVTGTGTDVVNRVVLQVRAQRPVGVG